MPMYRAFRVDPRGHINQPPHTFEAADDSAAIERGRQFVDGCDVELWEFSRRIALIGRDGVKTSHAGSANA
jgi:hypothetical protein